MTNEEAKKILVECAAATALNGTPLLPKDARDAINLIISEEAPLKIKGWVARDKDNFLGFYTVKPERKTVAWGTHQDYWSLPRDSFHDIKWEDEPVRTELTIKMI